MDRRYGNVRHGVGEGCGVDTRVATVSLKKSHPFFLNLPPLFYIIVIMSCCGNDTGYHCQQLERASNL